MTACIISVSKEVGILDCFGGRTILLSTGNGARNNAPGSAIKHCTKTGSFDAKTIVRSSNWAHDDNSCISISVTVPDSVFGGLSFHLLGSFLDYLGQLTQLKLSWDADRDLPVTHKMCHSKCDLSGVYIYVES